MSVSEWILNYLIFNGPQWAVDAAFTITDLKDIPETPAERAERAYYDSLAVRTVNENADKKSNVPIGKLVI